MRVSVVLLLFCLPCVKLQGDDDQFPKEDVQSNLNQLQNRSHEERPILQAEQFTNSYKCDVWTELRDMAVEQKVKLQHSQSQIEEMKKENTDTPKVAFSFGTGKSGSHGPFSKDTILALSRKITNIGNAFSTITGVFTAPVRVYYFRYTMSGLNSTHWTTVRLLKNKQSIVIATKRTNGNHEYAASGATLLLEKGDLVYLRLSANSQMWDHEDNHFSFSGFLLFPM